MVLLHGTNLSGRGMGAQEHAGGGHVECVPHIACRVVGRYVEQFKIIFISFNIPRAVDLETHVAQHGVDFTQSLRGGMQAAKHRRAPRQGDIQFLAAKRLLQGGFFNRLAAGFKGGFQGLFHLVGTLPQNGALFLGNFPQAAENTHDRGAAAQVCRPPCGQAAFILCSLQRLQRFGLDVFQLAQ